MVKSIRRSFIVFWLIISILGALNHTIYRGILPRKKVLVELLPHLRYGWVMFNRSPDIIHTFWYIPKGGTKEIHLSDLEKTPSFLYKEARVGLSAYSSEDYVEYLCQTNQKADLSIFIKKTYNIKMPDIPPQIQRQKCFFGKLINE